jgi:glutathione S-transferase
MVVHAALLETGAPFRLCTVTLDAGEQRSPDYLKLNPAGAVPTLVVDGQPLRESCALLMLLAERHPDAHLAPPPGSPQRGEWIQWMVHLAVELGSSFRTWFYPADLGWVGAAERDRLEARICTLWARIDEALAAKGPYLLGDRFSAADLLLAMYLRWSRRMKRPGTDWPSLERLARLVTARPAWRQVVASEQLSGWEFDG